MTTKAVCVVSGGLDSVTMLYKVMADGYEPIVLTFLYGQKHSLEISRAQYHADRNGLEYHLLTLPKLGGSALTDNNIDVPKKAYDVESQKSTVVPNRNMVFLSIAASYAIAYKAKLVFYAAHKSDSMYPDCSVYFVNALNIALTSGNYDVIEVFAPFIDMTKADIVKLGDKLGVQFEETWSCYDPTTVDIGDPRAKYPYNLHTPVMIHCGVCGTCHERKEAFKIAGVEDPTVYNK